MPIFIDRTALAKLLGVSYPTSAELVAQPGFPAAVKLAKRSYWRTDAVLAWVAAQ